MTKKYPLSGIETILSLAVVAFVLSPILISGYFGDDSLNSLINSLMKETGRNAWDQTVINFKTYADTRLTWLQLFHWTFIVIKKLIYLKLYVLSLVLLSIFLFSKLVFSISNSRLASYIALLLPAVFIQFRNYGDPILAFHGVTIVNSIFLFASLICLLSYQHTKELKFYYWSIFHFFLCATTYEIAYPLFLMHLIIIYCYQPKLPFTKLFKLVVPFAMIPIAYGLINVFLRFKFAGTKIGADPNFHKAYVPSFDLGNWLLNMGKQIYATLPLSYFSMDPHFILGKNSAIAFSTVFFPVLFIGICFAIAFFLAIKSQSSGASSQKVIDDERSWKVFASFGLCLLFLPSGILALSPKYRNEIVWGVSYVPVYLGYFGAILLLIASVSLFRKKMNISPAIKMAIALSISIITGATCALNFWNNSSSVESANSFWHYPRTIAEDAMKNGIMAEMPSGSFLFTNNNYPWDITTFVLANTGVRLNQEQYVGGRGRFFNLKTSKSILIGSQTNETLTDEAAIAASPNLSEGFVERFFKNNLFHFQPDDHIYYFDYFANSLNNGYAIFAPIVDLLASNDSITAASSKIAKLYVRTPLHASGDHNITVSGRFLDSKQLSKYTHFQVSENNLTILAAGAGWKLLELKSPDSGKLIDLKSLMVSTASKFVSASLFWRPVPEKDFRLKTSQNSILHLAIQSEFSRSGVSLTPISLPEEFTIEMIVKPTLAVPQVKFAHILGNHPGINNFEGFAIQWSNFDNDYNFSFGNGSRWVNGGSFKTIPNEENYVAIVVSNKLVRIFSGGKFADISVEDKIKNSALPLMLGNYINFDRPFAGFISEVQISGIKMSDENIVKSDLRLKK